MLEIKGKNPKQFVSTEICIPVWKVQYSYDTARGNHKISEKYIFHREDYWDSICMIFMNYIKRFNEDNEYRKVLNVKILDTTYLGELFIPIEG
ncbi:hypothetical protein AALB39_03890 [Lachnospiraceae bacterium 54-53]